MEEIINKLNKSQKEAVLATEGSVMVMAGAGSGKTRVLTVRIAHLIKDLGIPPYNILAVTFTNKAANEMRERISNLLDVDIKGMWVATFHSICSRILRIEIDKLNGYNNDFTIIDEDDAYKIIKEISSDLDIDSKEYKPKNVKSRISALKNDLISSFDDPIIKKIYIQYEYRLKQQNLLDFDDLIIKTIEVFKENPEVLEKYQNKFLYVMIDEFQDTNTKQYELVHMLSKKNGNVFVVGDQDQSIYSFRGAKIENINKFQKDFKNTNIIMLEQNYRSTKPILDIANKVINNNKERFKKNLFTEKDDGEKPAYYEADSSYDEVMFVIDKIKELHAAGYKYSDFAIMYRANSISRNFEDSFIRYQIPYTIYGGLSFFSRKEIKDVIAYLRIILNHDDDFSFKRIINEPKRKIGPAMLARLTDTAIKYNCSLFQAIDYIEKGGQGYTSLLDFKFVILELLESLNNVSVDLPNIIDIIINKTGYYDMLKTDGEEGKVRLDNVKELKTVIREADEYYEGTREEKLKEMLSDLALRTSSDNKSESDECVKMMTFHQAKGLEYKVVFLVAFEQGIFPSQNCLSSFELEEERRICYVGITRAEEKLFITSCKSRYLYGSLSYQMPSCYIREIGKENLRLLGAGKRNEFISSTPNRAFKSPIVEEKEKLEFKVGDKINHKAFGDGIIVETRGEVITVSFGETFGIKKLLSNHPSIRKI